MTAVEWLIKKLSEPVLLLAWYQNQLFEQAKEMEKQQIIDAHISGYDSSGESAKDYYDFYYGSNVSDEHIVDTNEMISDEEKTNSQRFDEFMDLVKSSQIEISNEEIEKASNYMDKTSKYFFQYGAKWYRQQLKSRQ